MPDQPAQLQTTYVWIPDVCTTEGPSAKYAIKEPIPIGKMGEHGVAFATFNPHDALTFPTKAECQAWCDGWNRAMQYTAGSHILQFTPQEHGFG